MSQSFGEKTKFSQKDKTFLLFITALLAVIWGFYLLFTNLSYNSVYIEKNLLKEAKNLRWFNVEKKFTSQDLKNRVILLNFFSPNCIECRQILPQLKNLERELGNKITIITINSQKSEQNSDIILKAILRNDISHAIINDVDQKISANFQVKSLPSLVLIGSNGNIYKTYSVDKNASLIKDATKLAKKFRYNLNRDALPILPEKNKVAKRVLSYPTKILYVKNFVFNNHHSAALFVANSGQNNIIATSLNGEIITQIGKKNGGFRDGNFENAEFNAPQGLAFRDNKLYVADTDNHALRLIDFDKQTVSTLIGNGQKGKEIVTQKEMDAQDVSLSSPRAIEFYPDLDSIAIANSGSDQILRYDVAKNTISIIAGSGKSGNKDLYPKNSLLQISDLAAYNGKLYFIDQSSGSLFFLEKDGNIKTLFANKNDALKYPSSLAIDTSGIIYVSDSLNNALKKYDSKTQNFSLLVGGTRGESLGKNTKFDEPDGIAIAGEKFYIVDSNNNRVVSVERKKLSSELLDILPPLQLPKDGFLQYLPNLHKAKEIEVATSNSIIKINLKRGWKINDLGPSFINLLEMKNDNEANLVISFDWNMIINSDLRLPKLDGSKNYLLQGVIYYCENKKNALCYVGSYEQKIKANKTAKNNSINVELLY